ncbi:hypothetical protein [Streptoalloteichus tenebrarius]|uniref:hypothetical protein n=1 Tax=Streptoalloteichus tenebrarius (strain ATCC 17920 / DSM 40477 / JCM 4838 / CBS 697.72 / NBRC 16177 / NCIMB 11028 / NRRL B-12390 / A12253. 1 / ISP 5477) TaxID=1933 RepID=UPI0020A34AEB|nr:hypothetical protein [Streptoalloteichus tenebrarius]
MGDRARGELPGVIGHLAEHDRNAQAVLGQSHPRRCHQGSIAAVRRWARLDPRGLGSPSRPLNWDAALATGTRAQKASVPLSR